MREVCGKAVSPLNLHINDLPSAFENTLSDPFVLPNGEKLNSLFYADDLIILSVIHDPKQDYNITLISCLPTVLRR